MLSKILERLPIKHSLCHVSHSQCVLFHPCPLFSASLMWAEYPGGACALGSHRWENQWKTKSLLKNTVANLNCWARPDLVISRNRMHWGHLESLLKAGVALRPSVCRPKHICDGWCVPPAPTREEPRRLSDNYSPNRSSWNNGIPPFPPTESHREPRRKVQSLLAQQEIFPLSPTSLKTKKTKLLPTAARRLPGRRGQARTPAPHLAQRGGDPGRALPSLRDEPMSWVGTPGEGKGLRSEIKPLLSSDSYLLFPWLTHRDRGFFSPDSLSHLT